jgi:cell division protease FtsH
MPEQHKRKPPHRWRGFWLLVVALLAINWLSLLVMHPSEQPRVKVPFNPYFLQQVQASEVKSIAAKGDTIEGTFAHKMVYPANSGKARPTTLFSTRVPTFWDNRTLTAQLQAHGVDVNAKNPAPETSLAGEVVLGFAPTLLLVGLFWFLARRAQSSGGGLGGLGNFGRSQARRVDPATIQVTFDDARCEATTAARDGWF